MVMPAIAMDWTVDMLDALPDDGNRYEIIDGELFVTPSPALPHQYVLGELHARLLAYLKPTRRAFVTFSPSDVRREDKRRNRVQPDLFVIRSPEGDRPVGTIDLADLLLVVEVLSPSTAVYDAHKKRKLYQDAGIPQYWIVDHAARTVAVWRPGAEAAELRTDRVELRVAGLAEPLVVDLEEFFRDALD